MAFTLLVSLVAAIAGAIASVAGFGIGSLLTPTFGIGMSTNLAVGAVSIPHFIGTAVRFWSMRESVNRHVVIAFGLTSAGGGLAGALLQRVTSTPWLTIVFGIVLIFVSISELTGLTRRMRFHGAAAWIAGAASGLLGGLIGNQGGIRSAALLGFELPKESFIASATAIGLIVDSARMPVYIASMSRDMAAIWALIGVATLSVVAGTLYGRHLLDRIPESQFRRIVAVLLALLGAAMLAKGQSHLGG